MIETRVGPGSRGWELSDPEGREQKYSLRRILVRRLQATNRGVSRRQRVEQHRRFAEEWGRIILGGRVEELLGFVQGKWGLDAGLEEGLIRHLATEVRPIPLENVVRRVVDMPRGGTGQRGAGGLPAPGLHSSWSREASNQADLFEPQLAAKQG